MAPSVPAIARPQMIRCLCGFSSYDGFTISCDKCARWCHAACFGISTRTDIPEDWKCWICYPRPGINKTKAVVLQTSRQARFEKELREKQLKVLARAPDLASLADIVTDVFSKVDKIQVSPGPCNHLITQCLILLLAIHSIPTPHIDRKDEILSLFQQINHDITEWGELTTVKALIRKTDINSKIDMFQGNVNRFIAMFTRPGKKLQLTDFGEPELAEKVVNDSGSITALDMPSIELPPPAYERVPRVAWDIPSDVTRSPHSPDVAGDVLYHRDGLYQNLSELIRREVAASPDHKAIDQIQTALYAASESLAALDTSLALSRSHQCRAQFMEICSDLEILDSPSVRQALQDDEKHIFLLLQKILSAKDSDDRGAILKLQGDDAESFMDLLQTTLDRQQSEDPKFSRGAHRLLVKLSEVSGILPTSLSIQGVILLEKEAVFGGGFADIYRGSYNDNEVALKRMRVFQRGQERHKIHRTFCKEALVWKSLRHPHILPFLGVDSDTFSPFLCMVSPWMQHGTIMRHLANNKSIDVNKLLREVAQGLNYLHSQNVVHGDLRGGNILINDEWQACLADFGLTVVSEATLATHTSNSHGSARWMAPELHDPESFGFNRFLRTSASDIYAFGCVCLEVYTGRAPFADIMNDTTVMLQVMRGVRPQRPPPDASRHMSDDMWGLIEQCWSQNPVERLNIQKIVDITEGWKCPP